MLKQSEISEKNSELKKNVYKFESKETKRRNLFISNYIEENFGPGKFFSKLKTYGCGSFSVNE